MTRKVAIAGNRSTGERRVGDISGKAAGRIVSMTGSTRRGRPSLGERAVMTATLPVTVLNAAAAFMAAGKTRNLKDGIALANQSIDSGEAYSRLQRLIEFTNRKHGFLRETHEAHMEQRP